MKGRPEKVYVDHGSISDEASWCFRKAVCEERLSQLLAEKKISWRFNLRRATWLGKQQERMVGLNKSVIE